MLVSQFVFIVVMYLVPLAVQAHSFEYRKPQITPIAISEKYE